MIKVPPLRWIFVCSKASLRSRLSCHQHRKLQYHLLLPFFFTFSGVSWFYLNDKFFWFSLAQVTEFSNIPTFSSTRPVYSGHSRTALSSSSIFTLFSGKFVEASRMKSSMFSSVTKITGACWWTSKPLSLRRFSNAWTTTEKGGLLSSFPFLISSFCRIWKTPRKSSSSSCWK